MPISGLSIVPVGALVFVLLILFVVRTTFGIVIVHAGLILASDNVVGIIDIALVGHENNPQCFYGGSILFLLLALVLSFVARTFFGIVVVHVNLVFASGNIVGIVDIALVGHENNPHCFYSGGILFLLLALVLSFIAHTSFGIVVVHASLVPASGNNVSIVDIALVCHENSPQCFYGDGILFLLLALVLSFVAHTSFGIVVVHAGLVLASSNVVGIVDIALVGHENNPHYFYGGGILFLLLALILSFVARTSFGIAVFHAGLVTASGNIVSIVDIALMCHENSPQCFYGGNVLFLLLALVLSFVACTSFGIIVFHASLVLASGNIVGIVDIALVGHENSP